MKRSYLVALGAAIAGAALVVLAGPASAHVTVSAPGATQGGGDQEITFRVPVEKTLDTVGLTIALPADTPIASVLVEPIPGWTHTQTSTKLAKPIVTDDGDITEAVSQINWKAQAGHGLAPGEFGAFTIIAGQLPVAASVRFSAIQTYSDGSVVKWNQTAAPGSTEEPDNPAPTLALAKTGASTSTDTQAPAQSQSHSTKSSSNTGAIVLAVVALVVALLALGLGIVSRARRSVT